MSTLTIGLLADTHIPYRLGRLPDAVLDLLTGVDMILHAGDVDDPEALEPLRALAPVHAVRGNVHFQDLSDGGAALPAVVELEIASRRVVLTHGYPPGLLGLWLKARVVASQLGLIDDECLNSHIVPHLVRTYPKADVIVFGHSHRACVGRVGSTILANPGAVCATRKEQRTVARMHIGEGEPRVEIVPLAPSSHHRSLT